MLVHGKAVYRQVRLLIPVVLVVLAACDGATAPLAGSPSPASSGSPSTTSPPPNPDQGHGQNPLDVSNSFFVVGSEGIYGPSIMRSDTAVFTITNNDTRKHQLDLVRLMPGESADGIVARVQRGGAWPPTTVRVLYHGRVQAAQETITVRVPPLKPGSYALVDMASGPTGRKPYASQANYVWAVQVVALSS